MEFNNYNHFLSNYNIIGFTNNKLHQINHYKTNYLYICLYAGFDLKLVINNNDITINKMLFNKM